MVQKIAGYVRRDETDRFSKKHEHFVNQGTDFSADNIVVGKERETKRWVTGARFLSGMQGRVPWGRIGEEPGFSGSRLSWLSRSRWLGR
jgi:hypothetical protein